MKPWQQEHAMAGGTVCMKAWQQEHAMAGLNERREELKEIKLEIRGKGNM